MYEQNLLKYTIQYTYIYMSTQVKTLQSYQNHNVDSSFVVTDRDIQLTQRQKLSINPRLSIVPSLIDTNKTKLQIYKQHLLNIQLRKQAIPQVPQPSIISCFQTLKAKKLLTIKKQKLKKQIQDKQQQYKKLKKIIDKYTEIYNSKQESMKEKLLLARILSTKLQSEFDKTKQKFRELQFSRIMNAAQKKLYFYQLAEIFFNEKSRSLFMLDKEVSRTDEEIGTCLGYLGFVIWNVAKIAGVEMWVGFRFKGPRSTITVCDTKMVEMYSSTSSVQNSNLNVLEQTYLLHPKEQKLNQALGHLSQQLKQIMKYSLGMKVSKSNNFYQLCQQLSKFLLNA